MKTVTFFLNLIYWMKAVHNYIIFLRSLHFVQYRPSSVYEVYGFL
jgi:hypothetical protein